MVPGNQPAVPATTQSLHCPDHPLPKQTITAVLAPNAFGILLTQIEIHTKVNIPQLKIRYEKNNSFDSEVAEVQ